MCNSTKPLEENNWKQIQEVNQADGINSQIDSDLEVPK